MREAVCCAALALVACVYPVRDPTGLELSWRFFEVNAVDGEDGIRTRSCAGAMVQRVTATIVDEDDSFRQGTFRFPCEDGYQTPVQFQTEASDAYIELDPGGYELTLRAVDEGAIGDEPGEDVAMAVLDVGERGVTVEPWELTRTPATLTLTLAGAADCSVLTLALYYEDAATQIPDFEPQQGDEDQPVLYRVGLQSERGLRLSGAPVACSTDLDGEHVVANVDRGAYLLEVAVDGVACPVRLDVAGEDVRVDLDVENLPCGG